MANETEYRFLLPSLPPLEDIRPKAITQGYLSTNPDKTVRIRRIGSDAFITVKGRKVGATAPEFEYPIPVDDAIRMLALCGPEKTLDKDRYAYTAQDGHIWEIDCFKGRHAGLVIAEIELPAEDTPFDSPYWMDGVDITQDSRFANAVLTGLSRDDLFRNIESVLKPAVLLTPPHP